MEAEAALASTVAGASANGSDDAAMSAAPAVAAPTADSADEEDDFFSGLAAADDLEPAAGSAALPKAAAPSAQQAAISHTGEDMPAGSAAAPALDVYADAAYWQDDGPAAQPTAASRARHVQVETLNPKLFKQRDAGSWCVQ